MKKFFILFCIIGLSLSSVQAQISLDMSLGRNSCTYIVETSRENWVLRQKAVQKDNQGSISQSLTLKAVSKNLIFSFTNPSFAGNNIKDLKIEFKEDNTDISVYWLYLENEKEYPLLEEETDDYVQGNNIDLSAEFTSLEKFLSTSSAFDIKYRELGKLKISTLLEGSLKLKPFTLSADIKRQNFDEWAKIITVEVSSSNMEVAYSFSEGHPPVFGGTSRVYETFLQSCFKQGIVKMQTNSSLSYSSDGGKTVNTDYTLGLGALSLSVTADRTFGALKTIKNPKLQLEFENAGFSVYSNKVYANITLKTDYMSININQDRTVRIFLTFET